MLKGRRIPAPPTHCDHKENTSIAVYTSIICTKRQHETFSSYHKKAIPLSTCIFVQSSFSMSHPSNVHTQTKHYATARMPDWA